MGYKSKHFEIKVIIGADIFDLLMIGFLEGSKTGIYFASIL